MAAHQAPQHAGHPRPRGPIGGTCSPCTPDHSAPALIWRGAHMCTPSGWRPRGAIGKQRARAKRRCSARRSCRAPGQACTQRLVRGLPLAQVTQQPWADCMAHVHHFCMRTSVRLSRAAGCLRYCAGGAHFPSEASGISPPVGGFGAGDPAATVRPTEIAAAFAQQTSSTARSRRGVAHAYTTAAS